jgi:hypothetical protein
MSSTSDVFTSIKHIVTAINSSSTSLAKNFANSSKLAISQTSLIKSGATRLVNFSVIEPGSSSGFIYDADAIDVVMGFNITSAIANGVTIVVSFSSGYIFPVGSSIKVTGSGTADGIYPVITSASGTVTASCTLFATSATGTIGTGQIIVDIPTEPGIVDVNWPVTLGIVVAPGPGQIVSVGWQ